MITIRFAGAALLIAAMVLPVTAADEAKKKKRKGKQAQTPATQLMKQLKEVSLTDEQKAKMTELGKKAATEMKAVRDEAGITPQLIKKRTEVAKTMKDSDLKGKARAKAINEKAEFTEAQSKAMQKVTEIRTTFQRAVVAMLTPEQKENLPAGLKRFARTGKGKGKGKKKAEANS
ncbi:MAG: Spy/CpxP family protein refolding chaperone [Planctomycetota bacterium]